MNKSLILALGCGLVLASCSDDLTTQDGGQLTPVTAQGRAADRIDGDLDSRVGRPVQKTDEQWILGFEWENADRIVFVDPAIPTVNGVIDLTAMTDDKQSATFKGGLIRNGKDDFRVTTWNLGARPVSADMDTRTIIDLSSQTGLKDNLGALDVMADLTETNRLRMTDNGLVASFNLTSTLSFVRFRLDLPDDLTYAGQPITVSGDGLVNAYTLNLADGSSQPRTGNITVGGTALPDGDADIYMALYPGATPELTFSLDIDGQTYAGTFAAYDYRPNTYYTKSGTDGQGCTVKTDDPREPQLTGDDDPANPLSKFATGNLYRVDGLTNDISDDPTWYGALYQWGRNYGYMDTKGIYENTNTGLDPGTRYTHWCDAMGLMVYDWDNCDSYPDGYLVYSPYERVASYTGAHWNKNKFWTDAPHGYLSVDDIKNNPTKFLMDARPSGRTEDYWISSFGNGGSNWYERAEACGYDQTNPCPEGWRLPTEAEFRAVLPSVNQEKSRTSLTGIFNSLGAEVRYNAAAQKYYVIRWRVNGESLVVETVVVPETFIAANATAAFWEKAAADRTLVSRTFSNTGFIDNIVGIDVYPNYEYYAKPHCRYRDLDKGVWYAPTVGHDGVTYPQYQFNIMGPGDNYGFSYGGYWLADAKKVARWSDRRSFENSSYIEIGTAGPAMGYAIRPVRAD